MRWPSISSQVVPWSSPAEGIATTSRRARRSIPTTYQPAVVPEIATVSVELPGDVAADLDDATRLLTAFDAGGAGEVAPFAAILLRSESAASSHIENLTSSARALAEAAIGQAIGPTRSPSSRTSGPCRPRWTWRGTSTWHPSCRCTEP